MSDPTQLTVSQNSSGQIVPTGTPSVAQTVAQNTAATVPKTNPVNAAPLSLAQQAQNAILHPNLASLSPTSTSTTTISNGNKQNQVPTIQATTNNLAQTGVTTNSSGTPVYANGTIVQDTTPTTPTTPVTTKPLTTSTGGYVGDIYYPPGATLPTDDNGNPKPTTETGTTNQQVLDSLNQQKAQADALTASIIDNIKTQYEQLITAQKTANVGQEGKVNTALLMGGVTGSGSSAQYAPISSQGIISAQISYGLSQIADLQNKENSAIIAAQQAGQTEDFQLMDKINTEISAIRDEKVKAYTKLNDQITAAKSQATLDTAVTKLYQSGITDPATILKTLSDQGLTGQNGVPYTADDVSKSLAAIKPTADELNRQQAAVKFALDNGVTKSFYLVGNTAIDTKTGLPVSLTDYQRATGQTGKSEKDTDFSQIQTLALPQVQKLMDEYIDAGIKPTDTLDQATAKVKASSAIYRKKTDSGGGLTTVGGNGVVAGVQVPASAAGDIEDVLAGRNTIMNIRLQMGRSNQAAAYLKTLRDNIHKIDPNFDYIASDAGGKFVSSTYYQKSAAAINSVMPNIDKVVDLSNQVSRLGVAGVDSILQKGNVQIGNQKVANFREAQKLIADEIGLALGQGSVSDMKLQLGFDVTDPSVSPEVFASNMGIVKDFINNRLQGLKDQRYSSSVDTSGGSSGTKTSTQIEDNKKLFTPAVNQKIYDLGKSKGLTPQDFNDITTLSNQGVSPDDIMSLINSNY